MAGLAGCQLHRSARSPDTSLEILSVSLVASDNVSMAGEDGPYKGRGIYPVTSLLNHACISNTRNIVTGRTLEVRPFICSQVPK